MTNKEEPQGEPLPRKVPIRRYTPRGKLMETKAEKQKRRQATKAKTSPAASPKEKLTETEENILEQMFEQR